MAAEQLPTGFASTAMPDFAELLAADWRSPRPSLLDQAAGFRGAKETEAAASLGLVTVGDLLMHLPRRHLDRGEMQRVAELKIGADATVEVEVRSIETRRGWGRRAVTRTVATVADASGQLEATWFNQPWIERRFPAGSSVVLHGRFEGKGRFRVVEYEAAGAGSGGQSLAEGLVPVHPAAEGLPPKRIRRLIADRKDSTHEVPDPLPVRLRVDLCAPGRGEALDAIHFPSDPDRQELARRRLAFDELLSLQLDLQLRRAASQIDGAAVSLTGGDELLSDWRSGLPFDLTGDQQRACAAIDADLARTIPMTRLLMGDVGSGKTAVALHAMLRAVGSGRQAMLMAPTETLAVQHMRSIRRLLEGASVEVALLTGSTTAAERRAVLSRFGSGRPGILVGTHALLEPDVELPGLALCVVDEQHRFGVRQRERLRSRGAEAAPHLLQMTATPIPRTLALAAHGDVDTTVLRELPAGRRPVETHVVEGAAARDRAYERIREEVARGGRAFVVCPLVEVSDAVDRKAATDERDRLAAGRLKGLRIGLLHGRMPAIEKDAAMRGFEQGDVDVLVSTTVIEVGIDVPEATVMLVEDASAFGLAQLHQLRGRVGRGSMPGLCLLCGPSDSRRLRAMAESSDGFALAELDLELRGEGELTGTRQSGLPRLRAADLPADLDLLERAHSEAAGLVSADGGREGDDVRFIRSALDVSRSGDHGDRLAA